MTPTIPYRFFAGLALGFLLAIPMFFLGMESLVGRPLPRVPGPRDFLTGRQHSLAAMPADPRVLIVGGSSVGNGLSAEVVQKRLGVPAYNYSFWVPLGAPYILHQAKSVLRPGDIALIDLEYDLYDWDGDTPYWFDAEYIQDIAPADDAYFRSLSLEEQIHFMLRMPDSLILDLLFRSASRSWGRAHAKLTSENWNLTGDEIGHPRDKKPDAAQARIHTSLWILHRGYTDSPKAFPYIRDFVEWARAHHVTVLATYPNVVESPDYSQPSALDAFHKIQVFYEKLNVPVLGTPQEAMLPADDFFDSQYHLVEEAIPGRTERLLTHWPEGLRPGQNQAK